MRSCGEPSKARMRRCRRPFGGPSPIEGCAGWSEQSEPSSFYFASAADTSLGFSAATLSRAQAYIAFLFCSFLVSRIYWSFGSLTCDSRGLPHDSPFVSELWKRTANRKRTSWKGSALSALQASIRDLETFGSNGPRRRQSGNRAAQ